MLWLKVCLLNFSATPLPNTFNVLLLKQGNSDIGTIMLTFFSNWCLSDHINLLKNRITAWIPFIFFSGTSYFLYSIFGIPSIFSGWFKFFTLKWLNMAVLNLTPCAKAFENWSIIRGYKLKIIFFCDTLSSREFWISIPGYRKKKRTCISFTQHVVIITPPI